MRPSSLVAILALLPLTAALYAAPITYTETFTGSVTVGSNTYNNRIITLTGVGSTSNVTQYFDSSENTDTFYNLVSSSFKISGGGPSGTFTDDLSVYDDQEGYAGDPGAGFGSTRYDGYAIMGTQDTPVLGDYQLSYSVGPITGLSESNAGGSGFLDPTNKGLFSVTAVNGDTTFQAVTTNMPPVASAVPEPSCLALFGTGAFGALAMIRKKYAHANA